MHTSGVPLAELPSPRWGQRAAGARRQHARTPPPHDLACLPSVGARAPAPRIQAWAAVPVPMDRLDLRPGPDLSGPCASDTVWFQLIHPPSAVDVAEVSAAELDELVHQAVNARHVARDRRLSLDVNEQRPQGLPPADRPPADIARNRPPRPAGRPHAATRRTSVPDARSSRTATGAASSASRVAVVTPRPRAIDRYFNRVPRPTASGSPGIVKNAQRPA